MRRKKIRKAFIFSAPVAIVVALIILLFRSVPESPVEKVDYARISLALARQCQAQKYAPKLFREASALFDSAMLCWKKENQRLLFLRDYSEVIDYALLSAGKSRLAVSHSKNLAKDLENNVLQKIDSLNDIIHTLNDLLRKLPLSEKQMNDISAGKLLLRESEIEYRQKNFLEAGYKAEKSEIMLVPVFQEIRQKLMDYFQSLPRWKKMAGSALEKSKNSGSTLIVVDKFARQLIVYQAGKKKYVFDAEFGTNWMQPKRMKGDKATPEGVYMVKTKIPPGKTKYFRALLLNYPNADDLARFEREKKEGSIPWNVSIGGLIEIHGGGGKQIDWTDGCIALEDSDMLKVYNLAGQGTPVVIVGSLEDLDTALLRHGVTSYPNL
ncbi:MAG TPA: L,D-transpeptidase [Bacteroidales bacterium]|nr:L,D-transpeptidase [Bacteroidales bacterium]